MNPQKQNSAQLFLFQTSEFFNRQSAIWALVLLAVIQIAIHIKYVNTPPTEFHQWRQTHTLAVARNFSEESMNILLPRVDGRGQYSGITGMEFPLVNYSIAIAYKTLGFSHAAGRLVISLYAFVAIFFAYFFFKELFGESFYGFLGGLSIILSPLFVYYSFAAVPDIGALAFAFILLYSLLKWQKTGKNTYFVTSLIALLFAGLIKVSFLLFIPYMLFLIYKSKKWKLTFSLLVPLGFVIAWYFYARYLSAHYHNYDFKLNPVITFDIPTILRVSKKVFLQWLPELYISYVQFLFLVYAIYLLIKNKKLNQNGIRPFLAILGGSLLLYLLAMYPQFHIHDYYIMAALPFLITLVLIGMISFYQIALENKWLANGFILLLILMAIIGITRTLPRFDRRTFELETIEKKLSAIVPAKSLVIACSDESPSIFLYFFHRKGWSITDQVHAQEFESMLSNGAEFLISNSREFENRNDIKHYLIEIAGVDNFRIFKFDVSSLTTRSLDLAD